VAKSGQIQQVFFLDTIQEKRAMKRFCFDKIQPKIFFIFSFLCKFFLQEKINQFTKKRKKTFKIF